MESVVDSQSKYKPVKLFYEQYTPVDCDPTLPPVVFVHGICSLHTVWNTVWKIIANATKRKVFSVDLRDHGRSEWTDEFSLELLYLDLDHFLKENGIRKVSLISHSLGGKACMYYTLQKPELVERLVVEEAALRDPSAEEMDMAINLLRLVRKIDLLPKTMTEPQIRKLIGNLINERYQQAAYRNVGSYVPLRKSPDGGFTFNFNPDVIEKTLPQNHLYCLDFQRCRKFHGPVLVLHTKNSATKVAEDTSIVEYFPKAKFFEFPKEGHHPHLDNPTEFIETVSKFLNN